MIYVKDLEEIAESDTFEYSIELYLEYKNRSELYSIESISSKKLIENKEVRAYSNLYNCYVQRFFELRAAPKNYLIENGFKPKKL